MDAPERLMPREKMLKSGIGSLTDVELLALFLRTGVPGKDVMALAHETLHNAVGRSMGCCLRISRNFAVQVSVSLSMRSLRGLPNWQGAITRRA